MIKLHDYNESRNLLTPSKSVTNLKSNVNEKIFSLFFFFLYNYLVLRVGKSNQEVTVQ